MHFYINYPGVNGERRCYFGIDQPEDEFADYNLVQIIKDLLQERRRIMNDLEEKKQPQKIDLMIKP